MRARRPYIFSRERVMMAWSIDNCGYKSLGAFRRRLTRAFDAWPMDKVDVDFLRRVHRAIRLWQGKKI